jgi:hypothetical protein
MLEPIIITCITWPSFGTYTVGIPISLAYVELLAVSPKKTNIFPWIYYQSIGHTLGQILDLVAGPRGRAVCGRSFTRFAHSNRAGSMYVCRDCCVLSGRSLCVGPITRPEESYRLWCAVVCDSKTSTVRKLWPIGSYCAMEKNRSSHKALLSEHNQIKEKERLETCTSNDPHYEHCTTLEKLL